MAAEIKTKLVPAPDEQASAQFDEAMTIAKPSAFSLDKFKSKHAAPWRTSRRC